jgi:hypothetical protein
MDKGGDSDGVHFVVVEYVSSGCYSPAIGLQSAMVPIESRLRQLVDGDQNYKAEVKVTVTLTR